jgi:hypothetical protein
MTHQAQRLADLSIAYIARQEDGEKLWADLKQNLRQARVMRRYCACMRLCGWLQKKIKELA